MLLLPALTIRQLHPLLSLPIGTIIFWGWSFALSLLVRTAFASESLSAGVWLFFGGIPGFLYCLIVLAVSSQLFKTKPSCSDSPKSLVLWLVTFIFCLCFVAVMMRIYESRLIHISLKYAIGPLLLLCLAMVMSILWNMHKKNGNPYIDANIRLKVDGVTAAT